MSYSSIIKKTCKCGCGKMPSISYEGYNMDCRPDLKEQKIKQQVERQKARNYLSRTQSKLRGGDLKLTDGMEAKKFEELQQWYKDFAKEIEKEPFCKECALHGVRTYIFPKFYRAASAHILPKRKGFGFPSVSTHPLNRLTLAASCGHHALYDRSWEDASQMLIFGEAVEKFIKIYPSIDKSEHKNIPECLLQYLEPENVNL